MPQHNTSTDSDNARKQVRSANSQVGGPETEGRSLSVSNVRPKTRIVSGVDLEQPSIDLFESAISDGDLTLARDALLAYRQEVDRSINSDQLNNPEQTSAQAANSIDSNNSTSDAMDNPSSITGPTSRNQGGRLEQLITEIEAEVRAEFESNQQESTAAVTRLQQALSQEAEHATALKSRIEELEAGFETQRVNHAAQIEQLAVEYQQQLASLQEQNRTDRDDYDQRIDELRSSRTSTADEIEAAWNAIDEEKRRWEAKQNDQSQELEKLQNQVQEDRDALRLERENWHRQTAQEQAKLLSEREEQEQELSRVRGEISRERAAWDAMRDRDTSDLGEQLSSQHNDIEKARSELAALNAQHESLKREHLAHIESFEQSFKERADRQRADLEQELIARRAAWGQVEQRERAQIESEKASLKTAVEQLQDLLERRKAQHAAEITRMQIECQRNNELWSAAERTRLESEHSETKKSISMSQMLLKQQRDEWTRTRDEEAAILRKQKEAQLKESNELAMTAAAQEAEQSRIDAQAAQLKSDAEKLAAENAQMRAEIEKERAESERLLHNERQTHFEDLQARQTELVRRQSITEEKIRQQEQEWAERQRQIEHDLNASRMLHQRKLDQMASDWDAKAKLKREELEQEEQAVQKLRSEIEQEKSRHQADVDEANRKLASDRHLLQDGLTQIDAQLKWVANHLGNSQNIIPFQPREEAEPIITASETIVADEGDENLAVEMTDDAEWSDEISVEAVDDSSSQNGVQDVVEQQVIQDVVEPDYDDQSEATNYEVTSDESDSLYESNVQTDENFVDPEETLFESESATRQFGDYGPIDTDLVSPDGSEILDDGWGTSEFDKAYNSADEYFTTDEPQSEDDETGIIDQGWVDKIRGSEDTAEPADSSDTKPVIPAGGEPEWACVVETAYVRSLAQRQEIAVEPEPVVEEASNEIVAKNDEIVVNTIDTEEDTDSGNENAVAVHDETINLHDEDAQADESLDVSDVDESSESGAIDNETEQTEQSVAAEETADNPTKEDTDASPDSQKLLRVDNEGQQDADEERRSALQDYRLKLLDLQAQLGDLNSLAEQNKVDE